MHTNHKRKMKRMLILSIVLLGGIFLGACNHSGTKNANTKIESEEIPYLFVGGYGREFTETSNGYYHISRDMFVYYSDMTTGKSTVFCHKINCSHRDDTCNAYVGGALGIHAGEDGIYLIENGAKTGIHLLRLSFDGMTREYIREIELEDGMVADFFVTEDELFLFSNVFSDDVLEYRLRLKRIDLKSGDTKIIFTVNTVEDTLQGINKTENGFYADFYSTTGTAKYIYYSNEDQQIREVFSAEYEENKTVFYLHDEQLYYMYSDWESYAEFFTLNSLTNKEEKLCRLPFDGRGYWRIDENYIYYYIIDADAFQMTIYDIKGNQIATQMIPVTDAENFVEFARDAQYLYFKNVSVSDSGEKQIYYRISIEKLRNGVAEAETIIEY